MLILNKTQINILVDVHFLIPTFQVVLIHINKVGNRINKVGHETTKWVNESTKWVNESTSWTAPNQPRGSRQLYVTSSDQWSLDITHDHLENMTAELSKFVFDNFGEFRSLIFLRIFEFDIFRNV